MSLAKTIIRVTAVFLSLAGLALILMGIVWIQGNMTLPGELHRALWEKFSWPWLPFEESSLFVRAIIDESLVCLLFVSFFLLNRKFNRAKVPFPRFSRALQWCFSGALFFVVLSCWLHTGIILWQVQIPFLRAFCTFIYFALVLIAANRSFKLYDLDWVAVLLGLIQIYSTPAEAKQLNVPMKLQRVSLALLAIAMLIGTPMSLDRFLFALPLGWMAFKRSA